MRKIVKVAIVFAVLMLAATGAYAWDVVYDASTGLLPTEASPEWQLFGGGVMPTISEGLLRIQGNDANYAYYLREAWAIEAGVSVTMEARMRVEENSSRAPTMLIQTTDRSITLNVYGDYIQAYDWASMSYISFYSDFTTLQTIRMAYDGETKAYVWVNDQLALEWALSYSSGNYKGIGFGSYWYGAFDSYWEYVAYSKEFLPVVPSLLRSRH